MLIGTDLTLTMSGTSAIALLAAWAVLVPAGLVLAALVASASRRAAILEAFLGAVVTGALVKIAGLSYVHPRPFVVHHVLPLLKHAADNSFPSDHAAVAGLAVAYLWSRSRRAAALAAIFAFLIGGARVAAQLHWPVDIAAGYVLGIVGGAVAVALAAIFRTRRRGRATAAVELGVKS